MAGEGDESPSRSFVGVIIGWRVANGMREMTCVRSVVSGLGSWEENGEGSC